MFACNNEDGATSPHEMETVEVVRKLQAENKSLRKKVKKLMDFLQQVEADRVAERSHHERAIEELQRALDNKVYSVTSTHQGMRYSLTFQPIKYQSGPSTTKRTQRQRDSRTKCKYFQKSQRLLFTQLTTCPVPKPLPSTCRRNRNTKVFKDLF